MTYAEFTIWYLAASYFMVAGSIAFVVDVLAKDRPEPPIPRARVVREKLPKT